MLTFLKRLILVPFGFVLGVVSAVAVLLSLGSEHVTHAMAGRSEIPLRETWELMGQLVILTSAMTLVPALALVIIGEVARIRASLYYICGGGAALVAVPLIARLNDKAPFVMPGATVWYVFATAGFVGGLVYWMVAGRSA